MIKGRDSFVCDNGPASQVDSLIVSSWQRSHELRLSDTRGAAHNVLNSQALQERCQANEDLMTAVRSSIPGIMSLLPAKKYLALICDCDGYILETFGDPVFLNRAQKVQLSPGANWREDVKGTNAIGIALRENTPVKVSSREHFVKAHSFFNSWAAPVKNLHGEIIGILGVSGEVSNREHWNLELTIMCAAMIEHKFQCGKLQENIDFMRGVINLAHELREQQHALDEAGIFPQDRRDSLKIVDRTPEEVANHPLNNALSNLGSSRARKAAPGELVQGKLEPQQPAWIGRSDLIKRVFTQAAKAAASSCSVLITGESGTGKEVLARYIHQVSPRRDRPFIALNCAAIPDSLIQSELFGYANGAFTGAKHGGSQGKFEAANNGTIFLDEIGETTPEVQVALLRVLQEKEILRLGEAQPRKINARVIAATNKDLEQLVAKKQFRQDLLYRLRVVILQMPPLRHRPEDIYDLVPLFVNQACETFGKPKMSISDEVFTRLMAYKWPGNVRELENCISSMVAMADSLELTCDDLPTELTCHSVAKLSTGNSLLTQQTRQLILQALFQTNGKIAPAARMLGMGRATLYRKLKQLDIKL